MRRASCREGSLFPRGGIARRDAHMGLIQSEVRQMESRLSHLRQGTELVLRQG